MNPGEGLSDAISAASLVLAVLAALYTLWLGDVTAALALTPRDDPDDRGPQKTQVMRALFAKALPLTVAASLAAAMLLPRGLAILGEVYTHWRSWRYDDVKAMFVLTLALLLLLTVVAVVQFYGLVMKRIALGKS